MYFTCLLCARYITAGCLQRYHLFTKHPAALLGAPGIPYCLLVSKRPLETIIFRAPETLSVDLLAYQSPLETMVTSQGPQGPRDPFCPLISQNPLVTFLITDIPGTPGTPFCPLVSQSLLETILIDDISGAPGTAFCMLVSQSPGIYSECRHIRGRSFRRSHGCHNPQTGV